MDSTRKSKSNPHISPSLGLDFSEEDWFWDGYEVKREESEDKNFGEKDWFWVRCEVEREESKENFCELQDNSFVVPVAFCWGMMCMV